MWIFMRIKINTHIIVLTRINNKNDIGQFFFILDNHICPLFNTFP